MTGQIHDVVVIGGGAAGLSAALMLGRARRSVVVVDEGRPRNAPAAHMHGFLSRDGESPAQLLAIGRRELARYAVTVRTGRAVRADRAGEAFVVELDDRDSLRARRLLLAGGARDQLPDIPGLAERWGIDVLHCPYCHGWEVRDQRIGVLCTGPAGAHQAMMFRQWTDRLTVLQHTAPLAGDDLAGLTARGARIVTGEVVEVQSTVDGLTGVRLADGSTVALDALAVASRVEPDTALLESLGLTAQPHPNGMGAFVPVDPTGTTQVPGVWAAGNLVDPMANVIAAAASGSLAGARLNAELIAAETEQARRAAAERVG